MATINLGAIKFNWKGAYNSGTSYAVDDVVSSGGNSYVCIQAHSNQAVGNATAYWNIMSSAGTNGTNGTDISTTLTAQGDMLYRDGSGLQRLAKGTASQELRMNSGATAPEWHTPAVASSDFVLLHTTDLTSGNPSSFTVANVFSSTYKTYKIFWALNLGSNHYYSFAVQNSSDSNQGGQYHTKYIEQYGNQSSATTPSGGRMSTGDGFRPINTWYASSTQHSDVGEMTLFNPQDTTSRTQAIWRCNWHQENDTHFGHTVGYGRCGNVGGGTHFKIITNGGDFENSSGVLDAYIKIYGLK